MNGEWRMVNGELTMDNYFFEKFPSTEGWQAEPDGVVNYPSSRGELRAGEYKLGKNNSQFTIHHSKFIIINYPVAHFHSEIFFVISTRVARRDLKGSLNKKRKIKI